MASLLTRCGFDFSTAQRHERRDEGIDVARISELCVLVDIHGRGRYTGFNGLIPAV